MMLPKPTTPRDPKYLDWLTTLPCLHYNKDCMGDVVAHHTATGGTGIKGDDFSCVPLCVVHHNEWHNKYGKKGPFPAEMLENIIEQLQHNYLTLVKKGES